MMYVLKGLVGLTVNAFVFLTAAWLWAPIAAALNVDRLPGWLALLHTHDDNIYGNITRGEGTPSHFIDRWKIATWWMMRNPAYGFDAKVLGIPADQVDDVRQQGLSIERGIKDILFLKNGHTEWGYRRDLYYRTDGKRYAKIWFGYHWKPQGRNVKSHMFKVDFNPFKKKD